MSQARPVFLNLLQIRFPVTAIASILHRVSGVLMFIALPFMMYALDRSLTSPEGFKEIQTCLSSMCGKLMLLAVLAAVFYHVLAGVRHLIMDMGFFESMRGGRITAYITIILAVVLTLGAGCWLW